MTDPINPQHYRESPIYKEQPIEIMYHAMTKDAFIAYCQGCVIKYIYRYHEKNGTEDLDKAVRYIEFMKAVECGYDPLYAVNKVNQ